LTNKNRIIMANDWKDRLGVVFSTNPNFEYDTALDEGDTTLPPAKQNLKVWLDRLKGGRVATVVRGFVGSQDDLAELGKELKKSCGVGGTAKDGEIIIQGDHRDRVIELLTKSGYKCKRAGG
jgi:translation initiation factor 1